MEYAVEVQNLSKHFGREPVLHHIKACLETGHIHGIVGRNGSGKTVLMREVYLFLASRLARTVILLRKPE